MSIDDRLSFLPDRTDPQSVRQRVEAMERVLERLIVIPGINKPVGLDVILDVVPVVGDIAAAALGAYIVWEVATSACPSGSCREWRGMSGSTGCWADPVAVGADPRLLLPLEHAQSEDDQAAPRTTQAAN